MPKTYVPERTYTYPSVLVEKAVVTPIPSHFEARIKRGAKIICGCTHKCKVCKCERG
jgi:hypothetical protein